MRSNAGHHNLNNDHINHKHAYLIYSITYIALNAAILKETKTHKGHMTAHSCFCSSFDLNNSKIMFDSINALRSGLSEP